MQQIYRDAADVNKAADAFEQYEDFINEANDNDEFERGDLFFRYFYGELAKFDRGEPAMVKRRKASPTSKSSVVIQWVGDCGSVKVDRKQLATFTMLFKHASSGGFVSLRAFSEDKGSTKPHTITPVRLSGDLNVLVNKAYADAAAAATNVTPTVFAPPICTFKNGQHAREADLFEGVALSVECDEHPQAARRRLEAVLGPATIVVASGGEWTNAETGKIESKLHLHWRLMIPARGEDKLADLKHARSLAIDLVGGDPTAKSIVHPLRWAGSVHRKREPRLCRIVQATDHEIDLAAVLAVLKDAPQATDGSGDTAANYFDAYGESFQLPIDIDAIFASMVVKTASADGKGNLHASFVSLTAAMCNRHARPVDAAAIEEIVAEIKERTMAAVDARSLDWVRETAKLKKLCRDWIAKKPELLEAEMATQAAEPKASEPQTPPPTIGKAAFYGLSGRVVELFEPHTEASPIALLIQFLAAFGNMIGRTAYYPVEGDKHFTNLFAVLGGPTGEGRKGVSAGRIRQLMRLVDQEWCDKCMQSGLSSGEGLIHVVRDAVLKMKDGVEVVEDEGTDDKRLYLDEREFAQVLTVMKRDGNTVSRIVRDAWDCHEVLTNLVKHSKESATDAMISIVGHITPRELKQMLDEVSMFNGYANRFLFLYVERSKYLPFGGNLKQQDLQELANVVEKARRATASIWGNFEPHPVTMDGEARELWASVYRRLCTRSPGLLAAICGRAEAQTARLALVYAVTDGSKQIKRVHLEAALALWQYCADSTHYIFGDNFGDPIVDAVLQALRSSGELSRTQIRDLFGRNQSADKISAALDLLRQHGKAACEFKAGGRGPKVEVWRSIRGK